MEFCAKSDGLPAKTVPQPQSSSMFTARNTLELCVRLSTEGTKPSILANDIARPQPITAFDPILISM